ncbi:MAG TPA: patatin-like phospholipase family protein [Candidatus Acidoferrum sp.]|jgi:NTE family protein|nr:patatin-like phospholipase family protein [Candidatus Acidoferrum sp.]
MKRRPLDVEGGERLAFLTKAPLERLTRYAQARQYLKGTCICSETQFSEAAYFILSGSCELRAAGPDGVEETLDTLGPGAVFGGFEEVLPEDGGTSVVAASDSVLLRIERGHLDALRAEACGQIPGTDNRLTGPIALTLSPTLSQRSSRHQIVALAFLSEQLPASQLTETLARWLCVETEASAVLVRLERQENQAGHPAHFLNGEFHMPARMCKTEAGYHFLTVAIGGEGPSPAGIASLVSRLSSHFDYVLIEAPAAERAAPWLIELLVRSDSAYLFLGTAEEDVVQLDLIARGVRARAGASGVRIKPIGCLAQGRLIDGFDLRAERAAGPMHLYVHGCPAPAGGGSAGSPACPTGSFEADLRRLARDIGGRLVGLALSSGAAKGFSHIGVLQVLEENGIEVDVVAGSSMGAYVGALWAYGLDGRELERLARELEERWALWSLVDPVFLPRQGFLRGLGLKKRLMRSIGTARFGDLLRPLRIVAGNLATLERVVFASGEVATAVHCSAAVPGICVPITIAGETYVDGAIVDPLPVDVLREMGVAHVIAVDAIPTPDRIRCTIQLERELAQQKLARARKLFRKGLPPGAPSSEFARGNLLQIVMRSLHGAQIRVAEASCRLADLVLRPNIYDDCWADCAKPGKFIALGREVAELHLDEIRKLVAGREINHERDLAPEPVATVA